MILAFLGPPAAGKGTQSQLLAKDINAHIIEVGAILRQQKTQNTPLSQTIKTFVDHGRSIPGHVLMQVIGPEILEYKSGTLIIDNFLRLPDQVTAWFKFADQNNLKLDAVIHLVTDVDTCWQRVKQRSQYQKRTDDTYDTFLVRYRQVYKQYIDQILDMLKHQNTKIITIDASPPINRVYALITKALKDHNLWPTQK
ncbi:MAG: nucleoside monophosphate kinase [bacterium]|nr:nucleoside monophosphate kinase [bacterium]